MKSLEEKKEYIFKFRKEIQSFDDVWDRADLSYYHSFNLLNKNLEEAVKRAIKERCIGELSKVYLTHVLQKISSFLK